MKKQKTGAARQARQRAKGRQVAVILPPPAAAALDALLEHMRRTHPRCTQAQAIATALLAESSRLPTAAQKVEVRS